MSNNGNGFQDSAAATDNVRRLTKTEMKRMQALEERKRRLINNGVDPNHVDQVIAREDYDNLPMDKKLARFEEIFLRSLQGLQKDIIALRHNDGLLADALDINIKVISRCLQKVGVDVATQNALISEVEKELAEEQRQRMAAQSAATAIEQEQQEKDRIEKELSTNHKIVGGEEPKGSEIPEGATVFGS